MPGLIGEEDFPRVELQQMILAPAMLQQCTIERRDGLRSVLSREEPLNHLDPGPNDRLTIPGQVALATIVPLDAVSNPPGRVIALVVPKASESPNEVPFVRPLRSGQ
jgi:hypothetical protein